MVDIDFNDFNMDEEQKEEFYSLNKEIDKYEEEGYNERDSYIIDALFDLGRDLSFLLTKTLIKNTNNMRKYKGWLSWGYLSKHYKFTIEELKEFNDVLHWHAVTYFNDFTLDEIEELKNYLNWKVLSYKRIDLEFFERFYNKICWNEIINKDIKDKYKKETEKYRFIL